MSIHNDAFAMSGPYADAHAGQTFVEFLVARMLIAEAALEPATTP
jgi:hypothetical protein